MKNIILLFLFLTINSLFTFGQTQGGNTNTPFSNPYQNPYGNTNQDQNIFQKPTPPPTNPIDLNNITEKNPNNTDNKSNENNTSLQGKDLQDMNKDLNYDPQNPFQNNSDIDYMRYIQGQLNKNNNITSTDSLKTIDKSSKNKNIYGSNFFKNNNFNLLAENPTTVPTNYRLGPGDELTISIYGNAELQQSYTIARDGSIFPLKVGKIYLQGLTYQSAQNLIANRFKRVASGKVDVSISKVRLIRVNVVGEVNSPGTYTMSAFNSALNAIYIAGGLTDIGNMRKIEIRRNNYVVETIDLYQYLKDGSLGQNIYLEDNDDVVVGIYEKLVKAEGEFKRPMFYQLTENETLMDFIEISGGFGPDSRNTLLRVKTTRNEQEVYQDFHKDYFNQDPQDFQDYILKNGDVVILKRINEGLANIVTIEGAVNYPDKYSLGKDERIFDIIKKAGGIQTGAIQTIAYVFRDGITLKESQTIKVNIENINDENDVNNIFLKPNDIIKILTNKIFNTDYYIDVQGSVRKPGKIIYNSGILLKDALLLAGGLKLDAENGRIEISNVVDSLNQYELIARPLNIRVVKVNSNLELENEAGNIILNANDRVFVRRKKELIEQESVYVIGEVDYPGEHALLNKNERLTSILKRTGGLTKDSYPEGAKLYRSGVGQIVIDLKEAMKKSGNKYDLFLQNGDTLLIPTVNDIVSVRGMVQAQVNIKFDKENTTVLNYIDAAGGFGQDAWKKRISVKNQNGRLKRTKSFLFFNFYPKVTQGSIVFVPRKPEKKGADIKDIISYTVSIASTLATIILVAKSLSN
ncbi:MAG: SLBB domain-containing protein [Chitinophagaceae bacterium]|nr:SLBB domain-containing protein [Chitinophagaceae bacterium]